VRTRTLESRLTKRPTKPGDLPRALANHELVVVAALLAGAKSASVDTEDIAMKANELAPGRFTWRKYKDQVNIDTVRKRLWDATKPEKGSLLIGSERTGWRLTKVGYLFARRHINVGPVVQAKPRVSQNESVARTRELRRMSDEEAVRKYRSGQSESITISDVERFFRIDDYVTGKSRAAKIERFRIMAANDRELSDTIDFMARLLGGDTK
jgi:hypothetical protein